MGDFDRFEKPAQGGGESKKLVMVVVLGAALLGLVGYQFVKRGPQPANAADAADPTEAPAVIETPATLREALRKNPTADLLRADGNGEAARKAIRNPFRMGNTWLSSLHTVPAVVTPTDSNPRPRPAVAEVILPQAVRAEDYKLSFIVNGASMSAIINGKVVHAGDTLGKARVLQITGEEVTLQHVDFSDGPITTLSLQRH